MKNQGKQFRRTLALILAARSLSTVERLLLVLILHRTVAGWCALTNQDMSWYLRANPATVWRALRRLVGLGVLERSQHPSDGRRTVHRINLHGFRGLERAG